MMTRLAFVLAFLASACCVAATPPCVQWTSPLQFTIANDPRVANGNTNGVYGRASWSFDKNDTALSNNSIRFVLCYAPRNLTTDPIVLPMTQLATQSQLLYSLNQTVLYSSDQHTLTNTSMEADTTGLCAYGWWNFTTLSPYNYSSVAPQLWFRNNVTRLVFARMYTNAPENKYVSTLNTTLANPLSILS
jgi:hypothetical protein